MPHDEFAFIKHNTANDSILFNWVCGECSSQEIDNNGLDSRRGLRITYLLCLITAVGLGAIYAFQNYYSDFLYTFSNIFPPFIAGVAVLSSFLALRKYWENIGTLMSKIWLGFTIGMFLWFLGELGWAVYTMILGIEIPYPSIADIFWLSGYVPLFIALLFYIQIIQPAISWRMFFMAAAVGVLGTGMVCSSLMIPVLAQSSEQDFVTLGISLAYPILDLALFLEAILALLVFSVTRLKARVGASWHTINAAIFTTVLADMAFSYTTLDGTHYNGHPLELLYHISYLLFALAFYIHSKTL